MSKKRQDYMHQCDLVFSKIIRARGVCEAGPEGCKGNLQCAHGFSRSYRAIRCDERNAFCLCAHHHVFFTHRPLEWDQWLHKTWGEVRYYSLRSRALGNKPTDWKALLPELRARLEEVA